MGKQKHLKGKKRTHTHIPIHPAMQLWSREEVGGEEEKPSRSKGCGAGLLGVFLFILHGVHC